jgi:hypothetical protein
MEVNWYPLDVLSFRVRRRYCRRDNGTVTRVTVVVGALAVDSGVDGGLLSGTL